LDSRKKYERTGIDRGIALSKKCVEALTGKSEIVLEIGCGHGHFLTAYAQAHPNLFCVGIDLLSRRIRLAREKKEKRRLGNLLFIKAEGIEILEFMPDPVSLELIFLLFPDPWPKKRHHRRRLIQHDFLDKLAGRSIVGGKMFFRTDHVEYFQWTAERIAAHPEWKLGEEAAWLFEEATYFQDLMESFYSLTAIRVDSSKK